MHTFPSFLQSLLSHIPNIEYQVIVTNKGYIQGCVMPMTDNVWMDAIFQDIVDNCQSEVELSSLYVTYIITYNGTEWICTKT
jgi:hypothetical protein